MPTDVDSKRIIVALDFSAGEDALNLARQLDPRTCRVKVGKELFVAEGPRLVEALQALGFDVFLDLKFHDIPNTVASACRAAANLGVWMVNVHALGGRDMLLAAREAIANLDTPPLLIGVTVLTSHGTATLDEVGLAGPPNAAVARLAGLVADCGLDGVVCSAREAADLRRAHGAGFRLVTPGIRPAGSELGDQTRVLTPAQAIAAGSDYLVIGRPISRASDPAAALSAIERELSV